MDELKQEELPENHKQRINQPTYFDSLHKFYLLSLRGRLDFNYISRAIRPSSELLIVGQLSFKNEKIIIRPKTIIGSDRMELYEYFGRRNEVRNITNRNWLKFTFAVTGIHFLTV